MSLALPWWRTARRPSPAANAGLTLSTATPQGAASAELQGLRVAYGAQPVLDGLDWSLQPGQVVGLLGRNGAGKTTLLESLLGLRDPQAGSVTLFGQRADRLDDAARSRIGYVPQRSDLFEDLRADELLAYFRSFYPRWNSAKVEGLMTRWSVPRNLPIGQMSGGEQQRLSIIRALAHEPDLLVLDEPVASLDPLARRDFLRELVERVLDRGTTVVFSTHILSDLERVAFNVAFLRRGRIALQAPLDALLDEVLDVRGATAALDALPAAAVITRGDGQALVRGLAEAALPSGLVAQRVSLEDLFEGLT
ncbi:MAG: ABC transporter ATP-binding protein [Burkholderiaceae bacterium]|nr:ABC transporter ATP-binding protein [Rhodoferax sp.]MCP5285145.1 ABC transporter ATP-binding protein [Burkholderiaceae bacterium]